MQTRTLSSHSLRMRLLPLNIAVALQGFMLWLPIEKLFMSEIGFEAAGVGVMAASYAAVIPIVEVPSGIFADRWSRRGVLVISSVALALTELVGGLSNDVRMYIVSALILGVYFAMYSGTMDSIVYDTVLEETGGSDDFEQRIGRVRLIESASLVASSLVGGWIASLTTTRVTYFLTIPFALLSIAAYLRFREPRLHKREEPTPLREHIAVTFRTVTHQRRLLPVITLAVMASLLAQTLFEFGPLWLVALAVPAVLYGPYWAALMTTLGFGGALAGRIQLERPPTLGGVVGLMVLASVTLNTATNAVVVTVAQIVLALLLIAASVHVTRLLHDAVPSAVRTGVASGVSALSWIVFLPFVTIFGFVAESQGVHTAGWMLTAGTVLAGLLLAKTSLGGAAQAGAPVPAVASVPAAPSIPAVASVPAAASGREPVTVGASS